MTTSILEFIKGQRNIDNQKTIKVFTRKRYLGVLHKDKLSGWYCDYCLLRELFIEPHRKHLNSKYDYKKFYFKNRVEAIRQITRAHYLVERTKKQATYSRDYNTGSYHVKHLGLEIGKIQLCQDTNKKLRKIEEMHNHSILQYNDLRHGELTYYWVLDEDLCKYLQIPFFPDENVITLNTLKAFVCYRLMNTNEKLISSFNNGKKSFDYKDPSKLSAIVGYFNYRESHSRMKWAKGTAGYYP